MTGDGGGWDGTHFHDPGCPECDGTGIDLGSPRYRYHVLDGDDVRTLRTSSAGGGLACCERCGKAIFVPGNPGAGVEIPVRRNGVWGSTLVTDQKPRFEVEEL